MASPRNSSRDKVRSHRKRLRERGLRPLEIWVTDTRSTVFRRAARRQALAVAKSAAAADDQNFIDSIGLASSAPATP